MTKVVPFAELADADLIVDAIYESSADGQLGGEPIAKLLPGSGNMGGFRVSGRGTNKNWVVLFTTGEDRDWPDSLDLSTGQFVYYGDNKTPGHELHDTQSGGNNRQAYEEVREDRHPIILICGRDIAEILIRNGYNTAERVDELSKREFEV